MSTHWTIPPLRFYDPSLPFPRLLPHWMPLLVLPCWSFLLTSMHWRAQNLDLGFFSTSFHTLGDHIQPHSFKLHIHKHHISLLNPTLLGNCPLYTPKRRYLIDISSLIYPIDFPPSVYGTLTPLALYTRNPEFWVELSPPRHSYGEALTPGPWQVILFGNRTIADVISYYKVIMGWWGPNPARLVSLCKEDIWTHTHTGSRWPHEHKGRDWGVVSILQGMPKIFSKQPVAGGEAWNRVSITALRRSQQRQHLDLELLAYRTGRQYISLI